MSKNSNGSNAGNYLFGDNTDDREYMRLVALQEAHDPATERLLLQIGLGPSQACVEIGAGEGSIARYMASVVGTRGHVVAIDINPRFMNTASLVQLEVRQCDVTTDPLERGACDLVHARFVLLHVQNLVAAIDNISQALKPGGVVLFEEPDFRMAFPATDHEGINRSIANVNAAILAMYRTKDPSFALGLPNDLVRRGFIGVGATTYLPLERGRSAIARIMGMSVMHLRGKLTATGVASDEDIDRYIAAADDPRVWATYYATISTWGKRP